MTETGTTTLSLTTLESRLTPAVVIPAGDPAGNYVVTFGDLNDPGVVGFVGDSIALSVTVTNPDGTVTATPLYSGIRTITVHRPNPEITDPEDEIDDEWLVAEIIYVDGKPPEEPVETAAKGRAKQRDGDVVRVAAPIVVDVEPMMAKVRVGKGRR